MRAAFRQRRAWWILAWAAIGIAGRGTSVWARPMSHEQEVAALSHYGMGVVYDLLGLTNRAVKEFEAAGSVDNDSPSIRLRLGAGYARLGDLDAAERYLREVVEQDPEQVQARYLLALIYSTRKDYAEAAAQYEYILKDLSRAEPENIEVYVYLGQLYYSQRQYEKAIDQFETVLKFNADDPDILFILGALYLDTDRRDKAEELFARVLKINPDHDNCLNTLGYLYAEDGEHLDEAERMVSRALEIDPDNGAYLDSLGWVYFKKGDYEKALRYLKEADQHIEDPVVYDHMGDVYAAMDRMDEARESWRKSLELEPDQPRVKEKLGEPSASAEP